MTRGLSGKMVSALDDELDFYFRLSVASIANWRKKEVQYLTTSLFHYPNLICVLLFKTHTIKSRQVVTHIIKG